MDDISRRTYGALALPRFILGPLLDTGVRGNEDWTETNYDEMIAVLEDTITKLKLLKQERIKANGR